jgi:hypothetical protein
MKLKQLQCCQLSGLKYIYIQKYELLMCKTKSKISLILFFTTLTNFWGGRFLTRTKFCSRPTAAKMSAAVETLRRGEFISFGQENSEAL